jgi:hypothetical protein
MQQFVCFLNNSEALEDATSLCHQVRSCYDRLLRLGDSRLTQLRHYLRVRELDDSLNQVSVEHEHERVVCCACFICCSSILYLSVRAIITYRPVFLNNYCICCRRAEWLRIIAHPTRLHIDVGKIYLVICVYCSLVLVYTNARNSPRGIINNSS